METGSKTATYWKAQSVSYLPRTLDQSNKAIKNQKFPLNIKEGLRNGDDTGPKILTDNYILQFIFKDKFSSVKFNEN